MNQGRVEEAPRRHRDKAECEAGPSLYQQLKEACVQVVGKHHRDLAAPRYIDQFFAVYEVTVGRYVGSSWDCTSYITPVLKEQGERWLACAVRSEWHDLSL
jgi:hypothetical protein